MHGLHQPIAVGTASTLVKDAMQHADEVETAAGRRPSDVGPGGKAKWASHSARRGGAKRALQTIHLSKVDPLQIDFHYGWDEMAHAKDHPMLHMYAGAAEPSERMQVTRFF